MRFFGFGSKKSTKAEEPKVVEPVKDVTKKKKKKHKVKTEDGAKPKEHKTPKAPKEPKTPTEPVEEKKPEVAQPKKRISIKPVKAKKVPTYEEFEVILDRFWDGTLETFPEAATTMGYHDNDDKLSTSTPESIAEIEKFLKEILAELEEKFGDHKFEGWTLDQRTTCLVLKDTVRARIKSMEEKEYMIQLCSLSSPHTDLPQVLSMHNFETEEDWKKFLARLKEIPRYVEEIVVLTEMGLEQNITQSRPVLSTFPQQIDEMLASEVDPIQRIVNDNWKEDKGLPTELRDEIEETIANVVLPAFRSFGDFMVDFVPKLSEETSMPKRMANGEALYKYLLEYHTTTKLTPQEVHDIGLKEVARITKAMEDIAEGEGFGTDPDSVDKFQAHIDATHFCKTEEELIQHYQVVAMDIAPQLPRLFGKLPRTPFGIKPIPAYAAPSGPGAYYMPPPIDLSIPGWFSLNTSFIETRKTYVADCLVAHEALPGHHLQIALATENQDLHAFRRYTYQTAYVEGWGLYSESLGFELGLYKTPATLFGRYQADILRACRLVVDTGMNYFGWSKQKALDYMLEHRAGTFEECDSETSRYLGLPGQACAYKIGEIKLQELRKLATAELGDKFDIRDFHDLIIGVGSVPLTTLEAIVRDWISTQK